MEQKEKPKKRENVNPADIIQLFKVNHIQLDMALKNLKDRIDKQFNDFSNALLSSLNHLNFIRYQEHYPNDDFKFIFKEKVNASVAENRFEQKQAIIQRMQQFELIHQDYGGVSDNCVFELQQILNQNESILKIKDFCPSGVTFLSKHKKVIDQYLQFWKAPQGDALNMGAVLQEMSPVFSRTEVKKIGSMFSQQNKTIAHARLLFRASQHNFQSALFKQICQGRPHTLMVAKSQKGYIFGGYTPAKWLNLKQKEYVGDPTATSFLFSCNNNMIFPIRRNQLDYAISAYGGWGPIYGSPYGPDLSISDKCHANENSCSSLGSHYQIPVNIKEYSNEAFSLLGGSKKFKIVQYEVYELRFE